ncbi:MAG: hypothetical protein E6Q27_09305 [Aeromicrobium sp.]|nr:MAG: hypothetical protein E6Q27_09305 [Aeromicrobium sp.]
MTPDSEPTPETIRFTPDPFNKTPEGVVPTTPPNPPMGALGGEGQRTHPLSGLVQGLLWGSGVAVAFSFSSFTNGEWLIGLISLPAGFVIGFIAGFVPWWFTRFIINDEEIRVESGFIFRKSRRIPFARLQSVDINQPLVARLIGMAELTLEMAGGGDSKTQLRFLPLPDAKNLRRMLLNRAHGVGAPATLGSDASVDMQGTFGNDNATTPRTVIATVAPDRLIIGILMTLDFAGIVIGSIALVITFQIFGIPFAVIGGLFPFLIGTYQMVSNRVLAQWDFTLSRGDRGLRITRGLLNRSSQTIPFDRIQGITMVEPYLWRKFGWVRLDVDIAGYGVSTEENGISETTLIPIADRAFALQLIAELVPDSDSDNAEVSAVSGRSRIFAPIGWRFRALTRSADTVSSTTGWVTRRTSTIPQSKIQSVAVDQGPWQRRRGLATLTIHSPDGPVEVGLKHMNVDEAYGVALDEADRARLARSAVTRR